MLDRQLREQIAEHERVLATRPPGRQEAVGAATKELQTAQSRLASMNAVAAQTARPLEAIGPFAGLSRRGRDQSRSVRDKLAADAERATIARDKRDEVADRFAKLRHGQEAFEHFEAAEGWRRDEIPRLQDQLDHHWAGVVAVCVHADDPLAFGIDKLRHARATLAADLQRLADRVPIDRCAEWEVGRRQLGDALRDRHDAEQALADCRAVLQHVSRRRWGRHDRDAVAAAQARLAIAKQRSEQEEAAERDLRNRLAAIARYEDDRQKTIVETKPQRQEVKTALAQLDAALDCTRTERVLALMEEPPPRLAERLGPPPRSPAGRAVWCHHALGIEATRDGNDGAGPSWTGGSQQAQAARQEIAVADRLLETSGAPAPAEWINLTREAATLREQLHRRAVVRQVTEQLFKASARPQWSPGTDGRVAEHEQEPSL